MGHYDDCIDNDERVRAERADALQRQWNEEIDRLMGTSSLTAAPMGQPTGAIVPLGQPTTEPPQLAQITGESDESIIKRYHDRYMRLPLGSPREKASEMMLAAAGSEINRLLSVEKELAGARKKVAELEAERDASHKGLGIRLRAIALVETFEELGVLK